LRGQLDEAATQAAREGEAAARDHALLFLAAQQAGKEKLAREQWQALVVALNKGNATSRRLGKLIAGSTPPKASLLIRLPIEAEYKRVLFAAIAKRFPETANELLPLARKLDFEPDAISLCLDKVLK